MDETGSDDSEDSTRDSDGDDEDDRSDMDEVRYLSLNPRACCTVMYECTAFQAAFVK